MYRTAHIISHTHWDREWFLTSKYTAEWLLPFFESLFIQLEKYPEYCFVLDGQTIMVEDYLDLLTSDERSVAERKIKQYVSEFRLLAGPYYLQPDWRLVSGESLVRNMLVGHQMSEELGGVMSVGWLLDNFGQISQAPQIHEGFGISGVYLWRGIEVDPDKINTEYLWVSPNGSKVTSIYLLNSYRNAMRLAEYSDIAKQRIENEVEKLSPFATTNNVLLMNGYDQEMVPDEILPLLDKLNGNASEKKYIQTTPVKYMDTIQKEKPSLQILEGAQNSGRFISIFPGTLSARMYLKQMNSECENLLSKWAEPMSAWLWSLGGEYPKATIDYAWKSLLQNHPHDNICGVSIDDVHSDMEIRNNDSKEASTKIIEQALITISDNINTENEDNYIVFNPSPYKRDIIAKVSVKVDNNFSIHEAETNNAVSFQLGSNRGEMTDIYFTANSIPGIGYKTFYLSNKNNEAPLSDTVSISNETDSMENKFLKVKIEKNGSVTVTDKITGKVFDSIAYFEDGADGGDTYNYSYPQEDKIFTSLSSEARITLIENGPLLAKFKIELSMELPSSLSEDRNTRGSEMKHFPIVTYVTLEANSPRLDFQTKLVNVVKDHRLRVLFPTDLDTNSSFSDVPFDVFENPVSFDSYSKELPDNIKKIMIGARESVPGTNLPLNSFVYLNDKESGASVLTRGLTEYEITNNHKIALTLFRSVGWLARADLLTRVGDAGPMISTPEAQCLRPLEFDYSFMPFQNNVTGMVFREAEQFNSGSKVVYTGKHEGSQKNESGLVSLDSANNHLVMSIIKKDENEDKIIIRLFNPTYNDVDGMLTFNDSIEQAEIVNLNEAFQSNLSFNENNIGLKVPFKKIITLRIKIKQSSLAKNDLSTKTKILSSFITEKEDSLNVNIPAIVTEDDIISEERRAVELKEKLSLSLEKQREVEEMMVSVDEEIELLDLKKKKNNIWGKVTTLTRSELEARLSFTLAQKKYVELYEENQEKVNIKMKEYDSVIREIGYKLNTARVDKRVAEYLVDLS